MRREGQTVERMAAHGAARALLSGCMMLVVGLILSSKRGDLPSRGVALVDRQKDTASALEDSVEHVERTKMLMNNFSSPKMI